MALALLLAVAAFAIDPGQQRRLAQDLLTGDWNARIHAVHELEFLGEQGRSGLALALEDADWQVRMAAAYALGPLGEPAIPLLEKTLSRDPCPVVRLVALHTLGGALPGSREIQAITEAYNETAEQLNACPDHPEPGRLDGPSAPAAAPAPTRAERQAELDAILPPRSKPRPELSGRLAPSGERLPPGTAGPPAKTIEAPASIMPDAGGKARTDPLPALIAMLSKPDPRSKALAADQLGQLGPSAASAVKPLTAALRDPDARVRASAALALGNIGEASVPALKRVVRALKDPNPDIRHAAALSLLRMGTPRAEAAFNAYVRDQALRNLEAPAEPPSSN